MVKKVIWPFKTQKQLAKIIKYIALDSYQNAEKVKTEILSSTRNLVTNEERHPLDKYKKRQRWEFPCIRIASLQNSLPNNTRRNYYHKNRAYQHGAENILNIVIFWFVLTRMGKRKEKPLDPILQIPFGKL
jgi:hypothetical protein